MARVATKMVPKKRGGWMARKRIPADVQNEYARLYSGGATEARFSVDPDTPYALARAQEREWRTEIENRIANIRAARNGDGQSLTPKQARALAGEWYDWFLQRQNELPQSLAHWEHLRDRIHDTLLEAIEPWRDPYAPEHQDLDDVWEAEPDARTAVRPILADRGETAQFLASRGQALDKASMNLFLDALFRDLGAALKLLIRNAKGDYSPDTYRDQFPKFEESTKEAITFTQLFKRWVDAAPRKPATVRRWRGVFEDLNQHFTGSPITSVTKDQAREWAKGRVNENRTAGTVNDVWINAARTISTWALEEKLLKTNPFAGVHIPAPRKESTRETKAFRDEEAITILSAALAIKSTDKPLDAAKRWIPWLCAYTGARVGEIAQLRGVDVFKQDGIDVIRITPAAGTVKTGQARLVPIHQHLLDQGFLEFVCKKGKGPLFYKEPRRRVKHTDSTRPPKEGYVRTRERLAEWVGSLGVKDNGLRPNHGWRHTFKQIAARFEISDRMSDYITGHSQKSEGATYGKPTVKDMAEALKKFPRYKCGG